MLLKYPYTEEHLISLLRSKLSEESLAKTFVWAAARCDKVLFVQIFHQTSTSDVFKFEFRSATIGKSQLCCRKDTKFWCKTDILFRFSTDFKLAA